MTTLIDRIVIAVHDLIAAQDEYKLLSWELTLLTQASLMGSNVYGLPFQTLLLNCDSTL